jgi:dihydrodipicolinate reductase
MKVIICSFGNLARAISDVLVVKNVPTYRFPEHCALQRDVDIAIFCGKRNPDKFEKFADFCAFKKLTLINASTDVASPSRDDLAIVNAPNLSVSIIALMDKFTAFVLGMRPYMDLNGLIEVHQKAKPTISGTAVKFASLMNFDKEKIQSFRSDELSSVLGVPSEHLSAHAYHIFLLRGGGAEMECRLKVHGRQTYGLGAYFLMDHILKRESVLRPGIYEAEKILFDPNFI